MKIRERWVWFLAAGLLIATPPVLIGGAGGCGTTDDEADDADDSAELSNEEAVAAMPVADPLALDAAAQGGGGGGLMAALKAQEMPDAEEVGCHMNAIQGMSVFVARMMQRKFVCNMKGIASQSSFELPDGGTTYFSVTGTPGEGDETCRVDGRITHTAGSDGSDNFQMWAVEVCGETTTQLGYSSVTFTSSSSSYSGSIKFNQDERRLELEMSLPSDGVFTSAELEGSIDFNVTDDEMGGSARVEVSASGATGTTSVAGRYQPSGDSGQAGAVAGQWDSDSGCIVMFQGENEFQLPVSVSVDSETNERLFADSEDDSLCETAPEQIGEDEVFEVSETFEGDQAWDGVIPDGETVVEVDNTSLQTTVETLEGCSRTEDFWDDPPTPDECEGGDEQQEQQEEGDGDQQALNLCGDWSAGPSNNCNITSATFGAASGSTCGDASMTYEAPMGETTAQITVTNNVCGSELTFTGVGSCTLTNCSSSSITATNCGGNCPTMDLVK